MLPGRLWWGALALAVLLGTALQLQLEQVLTPVSWAPSGWLLWPLAAMALGVLVLRAERGVVSHALLRWVAVVGVALCVMAWVDARASLRLAQRLAPALEGVDLELIGTVAEMPRVGPAGTRFVFEVEQVHPAEARAGVPLRVSIGWFSPPDAMSAGASAMPEVRAGDRWRLPVRLRQPHGAQNPHGFDAELWMFEREIGASGSVRPGAQRLQQDVGHPVQRLRQRIRDAIVLSVADPMSAGVIAALAVGDQAAIDGQAWELFRITGVAHLMSISGLHVTMFAWLAAALVGRAWRRSPALMLRVPAPWAAAIGGLLLAAGYALLAGWGVPAQRTVLMLAVATLLRLGARHWPPLLVLLCAGVAVCLMDPWALLQPGFWLSFAAVGLLMASGTVTTPSASGAPPGRAQGLDEALSQGLREGLSEGLKEAPWRAASQGLPARALAALKTQWVATVGLAPLGVVFFAQVSVAGFVANLLAIPLVTLLVTPLALAGMVVPGLWALAAWAVQGLAAFLAALASWPHAVWTAAAPTPTVAALGLLGGALAVLPLPGRLRALGALLMLPLLLPAVPVPPSGRFETVVVDVGQGTAVLVRTQAHLLVYDAGPQFTTESDAGQRVLLPLLRARGEPAVDLLMLSHRDLDHVGGAASLMRGLPVRRLSSSLEPWHPLRAQAAGHDACQAGQNWIWDGVRFEVLHPVEAQDRPDGSARPAPRPNARSCVLRVTDTDGTSLLLTGDIEAAQEAELIARLGPSLRADLLLVPHHGSRTSSSAAFIDAVQPRVALIQAGYRSRYGHPAPEVLARYTERGIPVIRSDRCGAWSWTSQARAPGAPVSGRCQRDHARRYWQHDPSPGRR